jgi:hypothetical protein
MQTCSGNGIASFDFNDLAVLSFFTEITFFEIGCAYRKYPAAIVLGEEPNGYFKERLYTDNECAHPISQRITDFDPLWLT